MRRVRFNGPWALISLARRPSHLPPGQQMYVQMRDGFARVRTVVDYEAEALGEPEFFRDEVGDVDEVTEQGLVGWR